MRKFTPILSVLLFLCLKANSQLSGTKTIPGDYATLSAAVTALNAQGVGAGGVTFNIAAGYTESISATISLTATGTSANPIVFQKSGSGANPLITSYTTGTATPTSAIPDGIIALNGSDYVTFDGIALLDNAANTTTATTMEYGFGLFKASATDGCQYNTIKNCTITLNRVNNAAWTYGHNGSLGIAVHNTTSTAATTGLNPTAASGSNSYNKFYSNTIQNCNAGISFNGYAAPSPFTLGDTGNDVGGTSASTGNIVKNFGGGASATNPANGVFAKDQWSLNCSYNTINSNDGGGVNHLNILRGIYFTASTSASVTVNNNTVTVKGGGTTSAIYGLDIEAGSTAAANTININNNTVENCTYTTATTGAMYCIYASSTPQTTNINNNIVRNNSFTSTTSTGLLYGIQWTATSAPNVYVQNNMVYNLTRTGPGTIYGIYSGSSSVNEYVSNNTIYGLSSTDVSTTTSTIRGIYQNTATGIKEFKNNTIYNLSNSTTATSSILEGIRINYGTTIDISGNSVYSLTGNAITVTGIGGSGTTTGAVYSVYKNKIYGLTSNNASAVVSGISQGGQTFNIYNNIIGNLTAPAANIANGVIGINLSGGTTANVSYNTVNLQANSTGALFGSSALYVTTASNLTLRNNILINTSTANGATGFTSAYRRSTTTLTTYQAASNNNNFYAGSPSANNLIYYDGTNSDQTIADFKNRVTTRESNSFSENSTFVSTTGSDATYLHISTTVPTQLDGGGTVIAGVTTDYDGDTRNASIPDVGADEFTGVAIDLNPPAISYTALAKQTICTTAKTITATIADASGVNTTAGTKPRLWYKKSTENDVLAATNTSASNGWKYVEASNSTSPFSFTFNFSLLTSPLNPGDSVSYFIVAQDNLSTPNVGASIVTFSSKPTSVALGSVFPTSGNINGFNVLNQPVPILIKTNKADACRKDKVTLDVDGVVVDGGEFQWQSSPAGANTWTNIVGATTVPYTTDSLTTSTDFRLVVSCGGTTIASSPSTVATFIVNNPQVSSTTPATRCGTGTVNLSATAPGYDINWYANATGGAPIGTGNTFTTPVINNTTTYYVGAASGGSTFSVGLPDNNSSYGTFGNPSGSGYGLYFTTTSGMTINSVFVYPQGAGTCTIQLQDGTGTLISGQQYIATFTTADVGVKTLVPVNFIIPSGGSYRLMNTAGTAYLGRFNPYSGTAYPLSYGSGAIILTQGSAGTTTYYSFFDWNVTAACEGTRTPVTATVTAPTTITPSSPNAIICSGSSATLNVSSTNSGYVYTWTPGSSLTGSSISVSPTTTTKYYVNANDAGTSCSAVDSITVTVQPTPTIGAIPSSFCAAGGSSVIGLNPSTGYGTGSIQWQSSPNNISFSDISGANAVTYTTPSITATTYYKALIKNGLGVTCSAPVATIGVYNPIVATTTPASRCGVGTVTLGATQNGGNSLNWYAAATGGAPIGSGTSFTTPSISTSTTYYVAATSGGASGSSPVGAGATTSATYSNPFYSAWSNTHNQHIILASELLAAGLTTGYITGLGLDVTSAGTLPMIDFSLKLGTTSASTMAAFVPSSGFTTVYTSASLMPTTGINTLTFAIPFFWDGGSNIVVEICHGNSASTATMSRTVKADITSYVSTIHTNTSAATAASVQCGDNTTGLTTYSVRPQFYFTYINGCESARTAVTASIVSPPAITKSAKPAAVCAGQSSSLSVSSTNGGYTYLWTPGNLTGASQTVTPTTTTKYYVAATDASGGTYNGCSNFDSITVTVNPVPSSISITASATTICNTTGSAALLTANGGTIPSTGYVGTGTTQNATTGVTNMPPYAANYTGGRHQILVLASELTAAGLIPGSKISSLAFDVVSNASTVGYQNFVIKIGSTTATALTTTFETSATTEVYNAPSFTPSVGWSEHTFSAPFTWDGTSNLLVETYFSNCGNTSASSCSGTSCTGYGSGITWSQNAVTNQGVTSFVSHSYYYSDANSCNIQTQATASTSVSVRPNMRFTASVPTTFAWSPLTGLYIDAAATTAYTGTNLTSVYAKPSVTTLYTATSSTSVPCSTSGTQNIVVDCSSVPVTLLNFNGERRTGFNILSWTTATEVNNAGFELERSNDGLSFSKIASIASKSANGNSNQQLSYSFNDYNQLIVNAYYRLKQLDKNGKFYYSAVVLIKAGKATQIEIVSIYPNPVKNELNIKIASPVNDKVELQLTDVSGKVLVRREVSLMSGDNVFNIPVAQFAQGVYLIKTICANGCESAVKKFVKE